MKKIKVKKVLWVGPPVIRRSRERDRRADHTNRGKVGVGDVTRNRGYDVGVENIQGLVGSAGYALVIQTYGDTFNHPTYIC